MNKSLYYNIERFLVNKQMYGSIPILYSKQDSAIKTVLNFPVLGLTVL